MASTYSPNLRLELIGTGDQQGTWGSTTNTNLGTLLEQAIGGYETVTVSDSGDTTLTANNGSADQSRNMVLNLTGTISAARSVICPAIEKLYVVKNATTGGFDVTFKVSGQTGVTIPNGQTVFLYVDGTDARQITGSLAAQSANNVSITGGSISNATLSNVSASNSTVSNSTLSNVTVVANASSLGVRDSDGSHVLSIAAGSNLTANRVFTLTTGDAARTLDISAGNVTVSTAGAALIDDADATAQRTTLGLGTIATQNSSDVSITGGSITGITDLALADGGTGASLADPNADAVMGWNDTAGAVTFFTAGTGISINATSNTISSTVTGGGNYAMQVFTNTTPGGTTWTKPAGLVAVKVTVVGGGGGVSPSPTLITPTKSGGSGGGVSIEYIPAPSIPGPVTVTVGAGGGVPAPTNTGGTSSFGAFLSATGGAGGAYTPAVVSGGAGSGGNLNMNGGWASTELTAGGGTILAAPVFSPTVAPYSSTAGNLYGGGASGNKSASPGFSATGAAGGQGVVIVEEFY